MNSVKIAGKILNKNKDKSNNRLDILLGIPMNMKVFNDGEFVRLYRYIKLSLSGLDEEQSSILRKGNYVEIIGTMEGNCDKDGNEFGYIIISPRTITKGVLK